LQIARVPHTMMMQGDPQAMDRLLELNGELDRYHGFGRAHLAAPAEAARRRPASSRRRARCCRRVRRPTEGEENFPPRKALKSHETRKSSAHPIAATEERGHPPIGGGAGAGVAGDREIFLAANV
jgi:hypothetical protein